MRILLTGGTGLIGRSLCKQWQLQGFETWVWSRTPQRVADLCANAQGIAQLDELNDIPIDAVVNLAGAPIADRPWTQARRELLWRSRVDLTRSLVDWVIQRAEPPNVLISGSASGWYGDGGETLLDESSPASQADFGSRLCVAWELEAERAQQAGIRVALLRTAPVLTHEGGMLKKLLPIYKLGLGGRMGTGQQWMPWIHMQDQVRLINHLLLHSECSGAFNACAPDQIQNVAFAKTLAQSLKRSAWLAVPAWPLRLALGEMSVLLLGGQRLVPARTAASGFVWQYPSLSACLQSFE